MLRILMEEELGGYIFLFFFVMGRERGREGGKEKKKRE